MPLVQSLQEQSNDQFSEYYPRTILGVLGTIALQVPHKDRYYKYEEGYYNEVMELLIDSLANGLTAN